MLNMRSQGTSDVKITTDKVMDESLKKTRDDLNLFVKIVFCNTAIHYTI